MSKCDRKTLDISVTLEGSTSLELDGNLYVGGLGPPFSEIPVPPALWTAVLGQGFVGCFKDLIMNSNYVDVASYAREQDSGKWWELLIKFQFSKTIFQSKSEL